MLLTKGLALRIKGLITCSAMWNCTASHIWRLLWTFPQAFASLFSYPSFSFLAHPNPILLGKSTSLHSFLEMLLLQVSFFSLPHFYWSCSSIQLSGKHSNSYLGFFQVNKNKLYNDFYFEKCQTYTKVERIIQSWSSPQSCSMTSPWSILAHLSPSTPGPTQLEPNYCEAEPK